MAEVSGLDMVRKIIGQINNLRRLVTINGKQFKWDGKKYVRAVDGKTFTKKELTSYVKDQNFRAPGVDNPRKDPSRPKKQTFETKAKNKLKSVKSHFKKDFKQTVNQGKNLVNNLKSKPNPLNLDKNTTKVTNPIRNRALQISKSLNPRFTAGGLKALGGGLLQGAKGYGIGSTIDWAAQSLLDRGMRNIEGKQKMSIDDYRALKDKRFNDLLSRSTWWGGVKDPTHALKMASQPQRITNSRGRTVRTIQPEQTGDAIGRSRQDPYINREPKVSYQTEKVVPGPKQGTDSTKKETVDQNKVKVVTAPKEQLKAKTVVKKDKKSKKNDPLKIHGKNPSSIQKKLIKAGFTKKQLEDLVTNYNKKYRDKRGW